MRLTKLLAFSLFLTALLALSLAGSETPSGNKTPEPDTKNKTITWHAYDVALEKAAEEDKHIFIDFTAKWCGYCRKMDREVFTDQRIIDILNDDFVSVKVDGDSKNELDIDGYKITERNLTVQEYGVRGFPTFWFLKSDGTKLGPLGGYRPTDAMLEALTWVKERRYDSTNTESEPEKK